MMASENQRDGSADAILKAVRRYWGFSSLRPIQEQAIRAGLEQRDSLVVLPTGGGKSLCYQVPPAVLERTDVVVSPLIALMKDQVDGLRQCGYPAAALHGGMTPEEQRTVEAGIARGEFRLLFVAPERLMAGRLLTLLDAARVRAFAVDEAHCISQWGHDFRPEYRQLAQLRRRFPSASMHAYTATATERVRLDIIAQLELRSPEVLIGTFDRPNLVYRIVPRGETDKQVVEILRRHDGEAAIVYCISRKDTERMASALVERRIRAACYHAGMEPEARRSVQDGFAEEKLDVVVATVAFGMGIDRSDVRCVIHAAMPKSIESYQQETGRAGRDGLPAECVMLHSGADFLRWDALIRRSAVEAPDPEPLIAAGTELLNRMQRLCAGMVCRHRSLSAYFGQTFERDDCAACDVCLGEVRELGEATVAAQKILSCVFRVGQRYGAEYVAEVLRGARSERIEKSGHHQLSTFGLMKEFEQRALIHLIHQLIDLGLLARSDGDRPTLRLAEAAWPVLRGSQSVRMTEPRAGKVHRTRLEDDAWQGVDRGLFESLRALRRVVAEERSVPAFVVFSDATLREMARLRPGTPSALLRVKGVGQKKLADLGQRFVDHIATYCRGAGVSIEARGEPSVAPKSELAPGRVRAMAMFERGESVDAVATAVGRARATTVEYLEAFIATRSPERISAWVDDGIYRLIAAAADEIGGERMRPIFDRLGGQISFEAIKLVLAHRSSRANTLG